MVIGVPRETHTGERRVALVPATIASLTKSGWTVTVEAGAGVSAGFPDAHYQEVGAKLIASRAELFHGADVLLRIRGLGADPDGWERDLPLCHAGQTLIGMMEPLSEPQPATVAARRGLTSFALELLPRITRAQSMDVLSSQANLAGYKAVLIAANVLPKILPMMMTAAGTIAPARAFIVGAGVAGLQAIATAKRLGAVVSAYDVRPAVKEQVESVGARFIELPVSTEDASTSGGYAKALGEEFYKRQAELMHPVVAESDLVITTAAIPGQKAPVLITRAMVEAMRPGSVVVDLAAERGGNCELTRPGEAYEHQGVTIIGPENVPSSVPFHSSQLYSKNIATFLTAIAKTGSVVVDPTDEIVRETLLTWNGEVFSARVRQKLGLEPLPTPETPAVVAAG